MENSEVKYTPTVSWLEEKYAEMNQKFFDGKLMECNFEVKPLTKALGSFGVSGKIYASRSNRQMFLNDARGKVFITKENFVELGQPVITFNSKYKGTEKALLNTLVHEMCHYYTYMNGIVPKQAHGVEFKNISAIIYQKSNGYFDIQRCADKEEMTYYELNDEAQMKQNNKLEKLANKIKAVVCFMHNGEIHLSLTSSEEVINKIIYNIDGIRGTVYVIDDKNILNYLFHKGYTKNMRTWRYWELSSQPWITEFRTMLDALLFNKQEPVQANKGKQIFSIKTNRGTYDIDFNDEEELFIKLKEMFPRFTDATIKNLMSDEKFYKMVQEGKRNINTIITEVLDSYIKNKQNTMDDIVPIGGNINLSVVSPIEEN